MDCLVIVEDREGTRKMRLVSAEIVCERAAKYITENREKLIGIFPMGDVMDILLDRLAKEDRK